MADVTALGAGADAVEQVVSGATALKLWYCCGVIVLSVWGMMSSFWTVGVFAPGALV